MFDFEKLTVYQKAKDFDKFALSSTCSNKTIDRIIINQLKRASLSIPLVIARGSAFECLAIFDILKDRKNISQDTYADCYKKAEELSMMLFAMIRKLSS